MPTESKFCCAAALTLALAACSSDAQPGATADCADASAVIDPSLLIDDMESQSSSLPAIAGRNGSWWAAGDMTPDATYQPAAAMLPERLPEPRGESRNAMRFSGQGFDDWGALMGLSFVYAVQPNGEYGAATYDAHLHTGVTFWARIGDTSTNLASFGLQGAVANPTLPCPKPDPASDVCVDGFGIPLVGLDTTWRRFQIPFTGLTQHPHITGTLDPAALVALTFNLPRATVFDLWVDDLAFY